MKPVHSSTDDAPPCVGEPIDPPVTSMSTAVADKPPHVDARLSHLFRASLKSGRIHPLYLPILRYRHTQEHA